MGRTLVLAIVALAIGGSAARSQTAPAPANATPGAAAYRLDDSVRAVSTQLRCPVCQGESIQESPADLAKEMRRLVRDQLAAGRTTEEVKAYFVSKYGEWILLEPKARGVNLTVYLLPFVMLIGGAALILVSVRRWSKPHPAPVAGAPPAE